MRAEWRELDRRIEALDNEFAALAKTDDTARRLVSIPGIGVLNADGPCGSDRQWRHLRPWPRPCGLACLVPRQITTAGKPRLLGISKRGNKYLRKLLVRSARSVLPSLSSSPTPIGQWLQGLMARAHKNTVVVALANKLARIVWAVLRHGGIYNAAAVRAI